MSNTNLTALESHLVSYAFLKIDSNHDRDYYDYFTPFVIEVLYKIDEQIVVANQIQELLNQEFKIRLPIKVIDTLFRRLNKQGILYAENRTFKINRNKIDSNNFIQRKQQILTQHSILIDALINFAKDIYQEEYNYSIAEKSLNDFIRHNQLTFLKDSLNSTSTELSLNVNDTKYALITANFIKEIHQNNPPLYNHLIEIIKGHMLLNAIYIADGQNLEHLKMQFDKTEIFFDTSFLLYALGYSGPELQKPCMELLHLLKASNAILRCFSHNVDEARGILEYCKNNLSKADGDKHGTIATFINNKYDENDVDEIIFNLENSIKDELKVDIIEHIPYEEYKNVLGEAELTDYLDSRIGYKYKKALEKDVTSISAIWRIRKGDRTVHLENCKALFVTTNFNLAKHSREYFSKEDETKIITPVIHDSLLMNLVWLKNPQMAPELPSSILMADCYAAGLPSDKLWGKYISILETLKDSGELTEEKVFRLKYTQGIKALVMDHTLGDEEIVTIGTVTSILEKIERQEQEEKEIAVEMERRHQLTIQAELQVALDETAAELEDAKGILTQKDLTIETLTQKPDQVIQAIAKNKASKAKWFVVITSTILLSVMLLMITYMTSNFSFTWKVVSIFFVTVIPILLGLFGVTLKKPLTSLENHLINYYEKKLNKFNNL